MNAIFTLSVIGLSSLIAILIVIIVIGLAWKQYKKGAFFCFLPKNHVALIELDGRPIHYLVHKADKEATLLVLDEMRKRKIIKSDEEKSLLASKIISRDEDLWGLLVKWFNLHMTSMNPFSKIKPVVIIPSGIKDVIPPDSKLSAHMKQVEPIPEKFLRLAWPRVVYIPEIELLDQVKINLIAYATRVRVWNFHQIYYEFSGKISEMVDGAISSAFIQHLGIKDLSTFQTDDMTANMGAKSLYKKLQKKGLEAVGAFLEGGVAVSEWELGEEQARIRDANLAHAAAQAEKQVVITVAEGVAEEIKLRGNAEASVIREKGLAFAEAQTQLVKSYNGVTKDASRVATAKELAQPGSNIRVISGNVISNLGD